MALGYKGGIGGKSWVPVEEMVAAFYDIVVIVQNMKRARWSKERPSSHSLAVASPTWDSGCPSRGWSVITTGTEGDPCRECRKGLFIVCSPELLTIGCPVSKEAAPGGVWVAFLDAVSVGPSPLSTFLLSLHTRTGTRFSSGWLWWSHSHGFSRLEKQNRSMKIWSIWNLLYGHICFPFILDINFRCSWRLRYFSERTLKSTLSAINITRGNKEGLALFSGCWVTELLGCAPRILIPAQGGSPRTLF